MYKDPYIIFISFNTENLKFHSNQLSLVLLQNNLLDKFEICKF